MKDEQIDRAIRNTLARQGIRGAENCPDDSQIAAYLDSRLNPEENAEFEAHAADCLTCREILALSMQLGEESIAVKTAIQSPNKKVIFHIAIPVSVLALAVVASMVGLLHYRAVRDAANTASVSQTAEMRAPATVPESARLSPAPDELKFNQRRAIAGKELDRVVSGPQAKVVPSRTELRSLAPPTAPVVTDVGNVAEFAKAKTEVSTALEENAAKGRIDMPAEKATVPIAAAPSEPGVLVTGLHPASRSEADEKAGGMVGEIRLQKEAAVNEPSAGKSAPSRARKTTADAMHFNADESPRNAITKLSKDAMRGDAERSKKLGDRTFVLSSGYWVDLNCGLHVDAPLVEVQKNSEDFEVISKSVSGLDGLLSTRLPVLVFWEGKNYLVRPQPVF